MRFCSLKPEYLNKLSVNAFVFCNVYVVPVSATKSHCVCSVNVSLIQPSTLLTSQLSHGQVARAGRPASRLSTPCSSASLAPLVFLNLHRHHILSYSETYTLDVSLLLLTSSWICFSPVFRLCPCKLIQIPSMLTTPLWAGRCPKWPGNRNAATPVFSHSVCMSQVILALPHC